MNKMSKLRRLLAIAMVFAIILCFTGCIRYKTTASVHKDGTVDIFIVYATIDSSELMGDSEGDGDVVVNNDDENEELNEKIEFVEAAGWDVGKYTGEENDKYKYVGFSASKEGIALEDLAEELQALELGYEDLTLKKDGDLYILDWDASSNTEETEEQGLEAASIRSYGGYMTFVLQLPAKAKDNNATKVEGKTLEWDLFKMKEPIHCEFKLTGGGFPMWIVGLIIGGIVIAAGIVAAILIMKKKKEAPAPAYASTFASTPATPSTPDTSAGQAFKPAEPAAPAFNANQSTGLPQVGQVPDAGFESPEDLLNSSAPIWSKPSDAASVDSLEELEALEEEPAVPIVPDVIPQSTAPVMAPFAPLPTDAPAAATPVAPEVPDLPVAPVAPAVPEVPAAPEVPDLPIAPVVPEAPAAPEDDADPSV